MPWRVTPSELLTRLMDLQPEHVICRWVEKATRALGMHDSTFSVAKPQSTVVEPVEPLEVQVAAPASTVVKRRQLPINKTKALQVLNIGFEPGRSYAYYMNKEVDGERGRDAIGCAMIAYDGDVDKARVNSRLI